MLDNEPLVHPDADTEMVGVAVAMREVDGHAVMVVNNDNEGDGD